MRIKALFALSFVVFAVVLGSCSSDSTFTVNTSLTSTTARGVESAGRGCRGRACAGSPESLKLKIYEAYVSPNTDCSDRTKVADHGTAGAVVQIGTDALIQASPANGTYKCLVLVMSDNLTFVPDSEAVTAWPQCTAGTEQTFDVYRTDSGDTWKDLDGNVITATGAGATPGDDRVAVFATTDAAAVAASSIAPHANQTITLTGELTVPGQTTFYVDFNDGISVSGGVCKIEGGTGFGFR